MLSIVSWYASIYCKQSAITSTVNFTISLRRMAHDHSLGIQLIQYKSCLITSHFLRLSPIASIPQRSIFSKHTSVSAPKHCLTNFINSVLPVSNRRETPPCTRWYLQSATQHLCFQPLRIPHQGKRAWFSITKTLNICHRYARQSPCTFILMIAEQHNNWLKLWCWVSKSRTHSSKGWPSDLYPLSHPFEPHRPSKSICRLRQWLNIENAFWGRQICMKISYRNDGFRRWRSCINDRR